MFSLAADGTLRFHPAVDLDAAAICAVQQQIRSRVCVFRVSGATISRDAWPPVSRQAGRDGTVVTVSQGGGSGQWAGGRRSGSGTRRLRMDSPLKVSRWPASTWPHSHQFRNLVWAEAPAAGPVDTDYLGKLAELLT